VCRPPQNQSKQANDNDGNTQHDAHRGINLSPCTGFFERVAPGRHFNQLVDGRTVLRVGLLHRL